MKVIILLGGNLGDSSALFKKTVDLFIKKGYVLLNKSSIFRSEAWGYASDNIYLNQVIVLENNTNPELILKTCLEIEKELGRKRMVSESYSDRPIDIDILYLDDLIIETKELKVPHPRLHLRRFTLQPLVEILPNFIHPILKNDHKSLLLLCPDKAIVEAIIE